MPGPKKTHHFLSKIYLLKRRVSKPSTRIPRQNNSVADIGFWWPEFVQIAFEYTLWFSWQKKKYLFLCIFAFTFLWISFAFKIYFPYFVFKHFKFSQSEQDKLNEATALNCCWTVETIIWFSFISPCLLNTYCSISLCFFLCSLLFMPLLSSLFVLVWQTETTKDCFWDEKSKPSFLCFCLSPR